MARENLERISRKGMEIAMNKECFVRCKCSDSDGYPNEFYCSEVEFLNIEEDEQGYDKMTFECPQCGDVCKSLVFS
jgi:hypothetical protein